MDAATNVLTVQFIKEHARHRAARPIIAEVQRFAVSLKRAVLEGLGRNSASSRVHSFVTQSAQEFIQSTEEVLDEPLSDKEVSHANVVDFIERKTMGLLYATLFHMEDADATEDEDLERCLARLQWVTFKNLAVPAVQPTLFSLAIQELRSMDGFKAPQDKLVTMLNACKVINNVLQMKRTDDSKPLSADDFLPMLIYCVIQANPSRLQSNSEFVMAFRHPSRLVAEDAYFFTALQSAIAFCKTAGPKTLDVEPEEFDSNSQAALLAFEVQRAAEKDLKGRRMSLPWGGLPATPMLAPEQQSRLAHHLHALSMQFQTTESASRLRLKEVPLLLHEYQELARLLREVADGKYGKLTESSQDDSVTQ